MPTLRQRKVVNIMVENGGKKKPLIKGDVLKEAGYSNAIVINPERVFGSDGFYEALDEAGLTDEFLNKALYEDIREKPQNRKAELELAYKLKGKLKTDVAPPGTTNNIIVLENDQLTRIAQRIARRATDGNPSSEN